MVEQAAIDFENPNYRRADPETSKRAGEHMTASGKRSTQAEIALSVVSRHPGNTAPELTHVCSLDRYQLNRRLADLEAKGKVRKGSPRDGNSTWWPL